MKKLIPIIGFILLISGLLVWKGQGHSQIELPNPQGNTCQQAFENGMAVLTKEWENKLVEVTDQEKPASEMVGEAFESMRTYRCWLEYLCRSVQWSGTHPITDVPPDGLTSWELGRAAGCQNAEDVGLPSGWEYMVNFLKEGVNETSEHDFLKKNKFNHIQACFVSPGTANRVQQVQDNYTACRQALEAQFGCEGATANCQCTPENSIQECANQAGAIVKIEAQLRKTSADQKARILENKLSSIISKMQVMHQHAVQMKAKFKALDNKYPCYAVECD